MSFFLLNAFKDDFGFKSPPLVVFIMLAGLVVLFSFFRVYQKSFSKEKALGRTLQYIGRRTLDVYLIHFFLIPRNLTFVTLFTDHPMPIIEATCTLIISLLIVAASLLIGNIFRLSPFLAHWLFGAKYPSKQ
jgi:fucose 4-O-acetylase-like acetyltransferase